jgi:hypothetical protein
LESATEIKQRTDASMHLQAARRWFANAAQQSKQGRLPRTIGTDDSHHLSSRDFK